MYSKLCQVKCVWPNYNLNIVQLEPELWLKVPRPVDSAVIEEKNIKMMKLVKMIQMLMMSLRKTDQFYCQLWQLRGPQLNLEFLFYTRIIILIFHRL